MISETEITVQGHGVHTAYIEITNALRRQPKIDIFVNAKLKTDIIHVQTMGLYALGFLLGNNKAKKVISGHLVPDSFVGSLALAKWWKPIAKFYLKFFYNRADLVLACSKMVKTELEAIGVKNVEVLYNSIDMEQYQTNENSKRESRKILGINDKTKVILSVGQVQYRKRFDLFAKMARMTPEHQFIWVGGMPFKMMADKNHQMNKMIQQAPNNLMVTGVIKLEEVKKYYQAADVFTLLAEQENHPMCVLEAAGAGLPILLRNIPNYQDTFKDGAILADGDEELITKLSKLLDDKKYRQNWSKKSALIKERFDSDNGAQQLVDYYQKLLKPKK